MSMEGQGVAYGGSETTDAAMRAERRGAAFPATVHGDQRWSRSSDHADFVRMGAYEPGSESTATAVQGSVSSNADGWSEA
jgi:hypothetical protein